MIKEMVRKELDHFEQKGIGKKVDRSEWSDLIVPIPKKDGSVHICGDYKVAINPVLLYSVPVPIA